MDYKKKSDFSLIPSSERGRIQKGFHLLEEDRLDEAIVVLNDIISSCCSDISSAFSNYALGVAYWKKSLLNVVQSETEIDFSIDYLTKSLSLYEHADFYLLLGHSIKTKILYVFTHKPASNKKDKELIRLIDRGVDSFKNALILNPNYTQIAIEETKKLECERSGFKKRLEKRLSERN